MVDSQRKNKRLDETLLKYSTQWILLVTNVRRYYFWRCQSYPPLTVAITVLKDSSFYNLQGFRGPLEKVMSCC
jgi:hypothetical protein